MSLSGTAAAKKLEEAENSDEMDNIAFRLIRDGHVPDYILKNEWKKVDIKGGGHTLRIWVVPDYMAVGTNSDSFRLGGLTPFGAQKIATYFKSILPSTKLVDAIQSAASPKFAYQDVKGPPFNLPLSKIESFAALDAANRMAISAFHKAGIDPGDSLTIGYRKAIVTHPNLNGDRVAIYGGRWDTSGTLVQPYSTIHTSDYSDYSHGILLVFRTAFLDGEEVDLVKDVFLSKDPSVFSLVSKDGRYDPVFPNAGSGSASTLPMSSIGGGLSSSDATKINPIAHSTSSSNSLAASIVGGSVATLAAVVMGFPGLMIAGSAFAGAFLGPLIARVATSTGE